jgi:hypothetical protein
MVSAFSIASGSAETMWGLRGAGIANAILSCPVLFCTARAISISVVEKVCFLRLAYRRTASQVAGTYDHSTGTYAGAHLELLS